MGLTLLMVAVFAVPVYADDAKSSNYSLSQSQFGSGSLDKECSAGGTCNQTSLGGISSGKSSSDSYTTTFGAVTPNQPSLSVLTVPGVSDLGNLDSLHTSTSVSTVKVLSYMTSGYTMQIVGSAPKYENHTITTLVTPTASQIGTEQFGINLVANTTPGVGLNPVQLPSSNFSYGQVSDNYFTPDKFMYHSGDTVAYSDVESGQTDYTITMIINVSDKTPSGRYSSDFSVMVVPNY